MSDDVDLRKFVVGLLKPALPKRWKWFDYSTSLDEITTTTAVLTLESIQRTPGAERASWLGTYTLTLLDPSTNPEQRENSLDDSLVEVLLILDEIPDLRWSEAKRGIVANRLGYDITLTVIIAKTTEGAS